MMDLEPYICTIGDCPRPNKTFRTKHEWFCHEFEVHRLQRHWACNECGKVSADREKFEDHITSVHGSNFTDAQLALVLKACERISDEPLLGFTCPLCQVNGLSQNAFKNHVGGELEQLALFTLKSGEHLESEGQFEHQVMDLSDDSSSESEPSRVIYLEGFKQEKRQKNGLQDKVEQFFEQQSALEDDSVLSPTSKQGSAAQALGICREHPSRPARKKPLQFPIFTVSYPPNEHFYGRSDVLSNLHDRLRRNGQTCIIHGQAGVGKTLLAVEYFHLFKNEYDCVFWLQADTEPGLIDSSCLLVEELGILEGTEEQSQIIEAGREWMERTRE